MITSALFQQYLHRLRQIPRDRFYKQPATKHLLAAVFSDSSIDIAIRTAILVAYEGLLRASEYVSIGANRHEPTATLLSEHVRYDRTLGGGIGGFELLIRHSKSDRWNIGTHIPILPRSDSHCPVTALQHYIAIRNPKPNQPFFRKKLRNGSFSNVTRADIVKALKSHFRSNGIRTEQKDISTHSLRIGAAFALHVAGIPWQDIMIIKRGRWSSKSGDDMATLYTRLGLGQALNMSSALNIDNRGPTDVVM